MTRREAELEALITEENLNRAEAHEFIVGAFRDVACSRRAPPITGVLPPTSHFTKGNDRGTKRLRVLSKPAEYVDRFFGLGTVIKYPSESPVTDRR